MNAWSAGVATDPLMRELQWFVRLRWVAGATVLLGMLANAGWFGALTTEHQRAGVVGVSIILYNIVLFMLLQRLVRGEVPGRWLVGIALVQIALDLTCLMLLNVWTGGFGSPLIGLFVLHMVFASLLLPRLMAYGAAAFAIALMALGTWLTGQWPAEHAGQLIAECWVLTLMLTVFVASHITAGLRERDARLKQQQRVLIQSEKMSVMGQMAAGVAHELANPLASMDSLLQLMQRVPARINDDGLEQLRAQIDRMNQTIHMMRTFAHPGDIGAEEVDLNAVVSRALDMAGFDRRAKAVAISRSLDQDVDPVQVVPQMIQQVVVNLVMNAIDAAEDRPEPRIEVAVQQHDDDAEIRVSDNGHGIEPRHLAKIFDPFFTTKPVGRGTGLGLAICYRMIEQHRGRIEVKSRHGEGTTFRVLLPRRNRGS
jgi:signal transduction histidine kinase